MLPTPVFPPYDAVLAAPFGALGVRLADGSLRGLEFLPPGTPLHSPEDALGRWVEEELTAYYANPRHGFTLPLELVGTPFRRRVWAALLDIAPGRVLRYGELARILATSPRAVGQAVGDNPIPLIIPCHRVVGRQGLGGFMHGREGFPLTVKRWLLAHEGAWEGEA